MSRVLQHFDSFLTASSFFCPVPGPDRKRAIRPYFYRMTYFNDSPDDIGCAMTWEVIGGRSCYQLALERQPNGSLRWHCTCADAIYRCENQGRVCKHVRGLLGVGRMRELTRSPSG